jgi:phosphomannomutase
VLAGNGIKAILSDRAVPTPVVSYEIVSRVASGGIVITASHNAATWNGIKYKDRHGASASVEVVKEIESRIQIIEDVQKLNITTAVSNGLVEYADFRPAYYQQIRSLIDLDFVKNAGFRIVADAMYGAGAGYFDWFLKGGSSQVIQINQEPNPNFPGMKQPEPIGSNLSILSEAVQKHDATLGIANDGDADRLGLIDENGCYLNQLQVYALLVLYMLEIRRKRGAIVRTITSSIMLDRLGQLYGVPVFEVPVGFKYVAPVMERENAMIGGEESGGYGYQGHVPERDGILSGLFFLDLMARTEKKPSELLSYLYSKVGKHYYDRIDIFFNPSDRESIIDRLEHSIPVSIAGSAVTNTDTIDGFRFFLSDGSWLLIRFSGTEPLLRIYAEAKNRCTVDTLLHEGATLTGAKR